METSGSTNRVVNSIETPQKNETMQADQNKFSSLTANIPEPKAGTISYKAATAAAVAAQNAAVSSSLPNLSSAPITVNGITKGKRLGFSEGIGENK